METTGKALVEHWRWAADKGLMNKNTAVGLRAACSQVLGVFDNWESVDLTGLDVEVTLSRFQNLRKKDFRPKTLEVYKARFKQALASYLAYLQDPGAWKPMAQVRVPGSDRNTAKSPPDDTGEGGSRPGASALAIVEYPFPLRDGLTARLYLPRDLKRMEVKRLTAFMEALAIDFGQAD